MGLNKQIEGGGDMHCSGYHGPWIRQQWRMMRRRNVESGFTNQTRSVLEARQTRAGLIAHARQTTLP